MLVQSALSLLAGLFLVSSVAIPDETASSMDPDIATAAHSVPINAAQSFIDVDAYPEAPSELELKQVHVYFRHGTCTDYEKLSTKLLSD